MIWEPLVKWHMHLCSGQNLKNTELRDRTDKSFLFWRFYVVATIWCTKMTSITPSIYYFSKNLPRNFNHLQEFRPAYIMFGPFRAIPFICNQRSLGSCTNQIVSKYQSYIYKHMMLSVYYDLWSIHDLGTYVKYCTRTIITRSWFESALDYNPRILDPKIEEFHCLVHKLSGTIKYGFFKELLHYECTSCQLTISSHQN